jgi:hypothetical protein
MEAPWKAPWRRRWRPASGNRGCTPGTGEDSRELVPWTGASRPEQQAGRACSRGHACKKGAPGLTSMSSCPSLEEFLEAPVEEVANVAPASMVFAPGGTRRGATLAGVADSGDEYARWARRGLLDCLDLLFRHGVRNLFMALLIEKQLRETTPEFQERIVDWIDWGVAGEESLAHYASRGWRVRLLGAEGEPRLEAAAQRLQTGTSARSGQTLWFFTGSSPGSGTRRLVAAIEKAEDRSPGAIIRALYGEDVPPATLLLAFGKPVVTPDLLPPLLVGDLQCYWSQRPSFSLDERQLRTILYDNAYSRRTWRKDKSGRAREALAYRAAWENGPTIGLGVRLGPFWYPCPIEPVDPQHECA